MVVSIVRFDRDLESLSKAIELCNGFEGLHPNDRVLLKPNIALGFRMPPYGMVTTTAIIDGLIQLLLRNGCHDISIGEGSVDVAGSNTRRGYRRIGIDRVAKRYGVKLIDFNIGPFRTVDLGGLKVEIAETALSVDFLINIPVLKTHSQTKVSLGFKNLKGCLSPRSRAKLHATNRLNHIIALLSDVIKSNLTVIDGIYALENGPDTFLGTAYRKNLIIAGRDAFACDLVGATILGIDPSEVEYLKKYAKAHNRPLDASAVQIEGEKDVAALAEKLDWKPDLVKELFAWTGIRGLSVPYPGDTLCSRCYATLSMAFMAFIKDNPNMDFRNAVICSGREVKPDRDAQSVILYGDCAIKNNSSLRNSWKVRGCPPTSMASLLALCRALLSKSRMLRTIPVGTIKLAGMKMGIYSDSAPALSKWYRYESTEFDRNHFRGRVQWN